MTDRGDVVVGSGSSRRGADRGELAAGEHPPEPGENNASQSGEEDHERATLQISPMTETPVIAGRMSIRQPQVRLLRVPLKIVGGRGGPTRAVAIVPQAEAVLRGPAVIA